MPKHSIDYSSLFEKMYNKAYKLEDVAHRIEKLAFGVVRFKDGDERAALWQVQSADDGQQYIVSLYEDLEAVASRSPWEVSISKLGNNLNIFYKGEEIVKVAGGSLGIPSEDLGQVVSYLPNSLASSKKLVSALLNELSPSAKQEVLAKYPELV